MQLDPETDLKLERIVDAPRDLIWQCWTTPEHIKQFFIPKPHRVTACDIDLRVGGRFNTAFDVDGNEMKNDGVFLEWWKDKSWCSLTLIPKVGSPVRIPL